MNRVHIGMIGAGGRLSFVVQKMLAEANGQIAVRAVYDPDAEAIAKTRQQFGNHVIECETVEALVERDDLEWVFIGSFNVEHASQAVLALGAGKHVFCEKPLATSLADCLAVRHAVRTSGLTFAFGLVLRYSPHYQKIKELVLAGAIGDLVSFEFNETLGFNHGGYIFGNWRRNRALAGTHLLEKCCHDLDLANWMVGSRLRRAASFGGKDFFTPANARQVARIGPDAEGRPAYQVWPDHRAVDPFSEGADIVDNQVAILEFESGVRATFHTNSNTAIFERRFYLCGTEGTLRADANQGFIELKTIDNHPDTQVIPTDSQNSHGGGDKVMAKRLAQTLIEGTPPLATVDDGIEACVAAFGIDQALDEGRVVDLQSLWKVCDAE